MRHVVSWKVDEMGEGTNSLRFDCRHYSGAVPCMFRRSCEGCDEFTPMGERVLIIKLGAIGDVLRTTPLLKALRSQSPEAHITWLTLPESQELLERNPLVDRVLTWGPESLLRLEAEEFQWVISLDKAPHAAALATRVKAGRKSGFGLHPNGGVIPLNEESTYAVRLGTDDELKFAKNQKTYQEIMFEQAGMDFNGEAYVLVLEDAHRQWASRRLRKLGISEGHPPVGLALGAGKGFANKSWPAQRWAAFADRATEEMKSPVLLLVGPEEMELGKMVQGHAKGGSYPTSGGDHSLYEFAALIEQCRAVVCGDTLAMHLAIGVGTPVVALFGPTCAQEIEFYGRGRAVASPKECSPCYRSQCQIAPTCLEEIEDAEVLDALKTLLNAQTKVVR
jgi:heptosyltransferase-2